MRVSRSSKLWAGIQEARRLNAFIREIERDEVDGALSSSASRWDKGEARSKIDGVVVAVKDNICMKDLPATAGSRMLENFVPPYDATVVERLKEAGAVFIGKTNMDEFGLGSFGVNSYFGPVLRPSDEKVAGGSSSGSAVAVACGACDVAIGTDTGGSVRLPAAFCDVIGFKPSFGRIPRHGVISYASSLDTVGLFAQDAALLTKVFDHVAGPDDRDMTCIRTPWRKTMSESSLLDRISRIGVPLDFNVEELPDSAREAWASTTEKIAKVFNAEIVPLDLESIRNALPAYYVIACAEVSSNLARYDGVQYGFRQLDQSEMDERITLHDEYTTTRTLGFGMEVKRRILMGAHVLSAAEFDDLYVNACRIREKLKSDFVAAFENVDIMVAPVSPVDAPEAEDARNQSPVESYLTDVMTVPASLAGIPSVSLPTSLGTAIQIMAPSKEDRKILESTEALFGNI